MPDEGRRVCCSVLRRTSSESTRESWMEEPLLAAEEVEEGQEGWLALKSPRMRVSPWVWKSGSCAGEKPGGQEEEGGM